MAVKKKAIQQDIPNHRYEARYPDDHTYCDFQWDNLFCQQAEEGKIHNMGPRRIIIERRELVGEVIEDPNGTEPMVKMAIEIAGKYVVENFPCEVQFQDGTAIFKISGAEVE